MFQMPKGQAGVVAPIKQLAMPDLLVALLPAYLSQFLHLHRAIRFFTHFTS
jgi:hypothetical protein